MKRLRGVGIAYSLPTTAPSLRTVAPPTAPSRNGLQPGFAELRPKQLHELWPEVEGFKEFCDVVALI